MGHMLARRIEAALELPTGWMDQAQHDQPADRTCPPLTTKQFRAPSPGFPEWTARPAGGLAARRTPKTPTAENPRRKIFSQLLAQNY